MRYPIRRAAVLGLALLTAMVSAPAVPAAAEVEPFTVVNSASLAGGPVPRGARLTIHTAGPVTPHRFVFFPWTQTAPDGLFVEGSCADHDTLMRLPMLFVGEFQGGTRIDVYYPNSIGPEPWGACANSGPSLIRVHPAGSDGYLEDVIETVTAHPGIFMVGDAPAGDHVDGVDADARTPLLLCNERLPAVPTACPVRTVGSPARLEVYLTGAELFTCRCTPETLVVELAPAGGGDWVPQRLDSVVRADNGLELATIELRPDTAAGAYQLRVRNTFRPEFPKAVAVEFGQPA